MARAQRDTERQDKAVGFKDGFKLAYHKHLL